MKGVCVSMSMDHINRISEERARIWEQAKALLADADGDASRDLSAEDQAQFDRMMADLDQLDARRSTLLDAIKRDQDIAESRERAGVRQVFDGATPPAADDLSADDQFRKLANGELRQLEFSKRSNTKSSATGTVPTSVYDQIITYLVQTNVVRDVSTVITTSGGENLTIPTVSARSTAALTAEAAQISNSDPTWATRTLSAYKLGVIVDVSRELIADAAVDVSGYIARQAGEALGILGRGYMTTGTGSSQPAGVVTGSTVGVTGSSGVAGRFTGDNLMDLFYSVGAPYRSAPGFAWMMNSTTLGAVRKLKADTGTYGSTEYLFQLGMGGAQADTLLGKPIIVNESVASVALSAKSVLVGDFSRFYVREAGGLIVETSDQYKFDYDLVGFKVILRTDSLLVDTTAVKHFIGNAA